MMLDRKQAPRSAGWVLGTALSALALGAAIGPLSLPAQAQQGEVATLEFREALEVYGSWVPHRRWGDVWVPASVPRDWQPYSNGRWVYTEEWGWYWVSEDPWGWITDHYGRWVFDDGVGWVWVPGDEWAPAWVQWRQGAPQGAQFVGWAPLPPDEIVDEYVENPAVWVFVPTRYLTAPRIRTFIVPRPRRLIYIRETYVVNRTVRLRDRGPRIAVNPGIPAPYIAAALRRPIRAAEVRPVVLRGTVGVHGAREIRPNEVRIYRERMGERRDARDRPDGRRGPGGDPFRVIVRETPTTIRPATVVPPAARLEHGAPGRLGDRPPRAAVGVPAGVGGSPQPGTVQPAVPRPGTVQPVPTAPGPGIAQPPPSQPAAPTTAQPPRRIEDRRPPPSATTPIVPGAPAPAAAPRAPTTSPPATVRPLPSQPGAPPPAAVQRPAPPPPPLQRPPPQPAAPPPAAVQRPPPPPPPAAVQRPVPSVVPPPPAALQRPPSQQQPAARPSGQPPRDQDRRQRKPGEPDPPR